MQLCNLSAQDAQSLAISQACDHLRRQATEQANAAADVAHALLLQPTFARGYGQLLAAQQLFESCASEQRLLARRAWLTVEVQS